MFTMTDFLVVLGCLIATLALFRFYLKRSRLRRLAQENKTVPITRVLSREVAATAIHKIDFGYGPEIWLLLSENQAIDPAKKVYVDGVCIVPTPSSSETKQIASILHLSVERYSVKY